jgi:HK97 family phage portal protein
LSLSTTLQRILKGSLPPTILRATTFPPTSPSDPAQWLVDAWGGPPTKSGISISSLDALRSTAVLSCVRILSETVASLPLVVYRRLEPRGKLKAPEHPLYKILHSQANPLMTSFEWRELLMGHLTLWGNHYSEIERDNAGTPIALWPLRPDKMRIEGKGKELLYYYTPPNSTEQFISQENVLHLKSISGNGYVGQSLIGFAREAIGLGLAMEDFTARFFSNDATPKTYIKHPLRLNEKSRANLTESFDKKGKGLENKFRMQILEEGMDIVSVGMPLSDAQFLELRKFEELDVYKIFRVPPHKGGILDRATFSNIEHQGIEFVTDTMLPWFTRLEQRLNTTLFFEDEQEEYFVEFIVDGLLRGDTLTRYQAYEKAWQTGWMNQDEIRDKENMNPIPGGKGQTYYVPLNFAPLGTQIQPPKVIQSRKINGNGHDIDEEEHVNEQ